ncbi:PilZ domain-containing protein [Porphyrobacter sp. LM 6]|uniref:PilZ domain-containing protein n=1 Tax=Porphyrobacter sp. LM 6 TaxID=1896196 RepID=UPI0008463F51|nr:PilZ domain-containing protein [Porphyrobacter sp. LM 6]
MSRHSKKHILSVLDQRSATRYAIHFLADGLAPQRSFDVCIRSISADGLAIETSTELRIGTEFELTLPISGPTKAKVVWNNGTISGCLFEAPLDMAVLSAVRLKAHPACAGGARLNEPLSTMVQLAAPERWPRRVRVAIHILGPLTIWALIALLAKLVS